MNICIIPRVALRSIFHVPETGEIEVIDGSLAGERKPGSANCEVYNPQSFAHPPNLRQNIKLHALWRFCGSLINSPFAKEGGIVIGQHTVIYPLGVKYKIVHAIMIILSRIKASK